MSLSLKEGIMRKLKSTDIFVAMRLVKAAGTRDEVKKVGMLVKDNPKLSINEIGADLILGVIEGLANVGAEKIFFEFAAGILEEDAKTLMDMHPLQLIETLKTYIKEVESPEEWRRFFDSLAAIL